MTFIRNLLLIVISALTLSACNAEEPDYKAWLAEGVLIDTRTTGEYNAGHMTGATLIPHDQITRYIGQVAENKDTPILLYCRSGRRAGIAEKALLKMGYTKVHNVGGLQDIVDFVKKYGN